MRCSICDKEGNRRFCEECGGKMVEKKMDALVIRSGKLKDCSTCGAELVQNNKFCECCGSKVDQSLFYYLQHTCPRCFTDVVQGIQFCMECGYNLKQQAETELTEERTSIVDNFIVQDANECHEILCEQCYEFGETANAEGFCNECLEYMCTTCVKYHKRQNPQHNFLDRTSMPQDFCFEQCPIHQKHIRFYCPKCELFACSDCRKANHATCDNINHVSTMAIRIEESNELKVVLKDIDLFSNTLKRVQNTLEDGVEAIKTKEKLTQRSIEQSSQSRKSHFDEEKQKCTATFDKYLKDISSLIKEEKQRTITRLRKEQNDLDIRMTVTENEKLEELRKSFKDDVGAHQSLLAICASLLDEVKGNACDLYQKKERNERCKLFIAMKKTSSEMKKLKRKLDMLTNQTAALKINTLPDRIKTDARSYQVSVMSQSTRYDGNKSTDHPSEITRKSGSVNPEEVTSAHLISYDPQHDVLPLVLAICQYVFAIGKGTKIGYDFAALERQLMDIVLFSKSRIDSGRVLMV